MFLILEEPKLRTGDFITETPLSHEELDYFGECKEYYQLTKQPLVCISDEVLAHDSVYSHITLKIAIDENCTQFELQAFMNKFCAETHLNQDLLTLKRIQQGSVVLEAEIANKLRPRSLKLKLKMIYNSLTERLREELAKIKIFFLFMG